MKTKKLLAVIIAFSLTIVGMISENNALAARRITMSKTLTITKGKSKTLKVKNTKKTVRWKILSGKKNIKIKKKGKYAISIKGKKKGTAKIRAIIGKKKLNCKITVKDDASSKASQNNKNNSSSSTDNSKNTTPLADETKNANDVAALKKLIQEQRAKGATVSENISDEREYEWEKSRLVSIKWGAKDSSLGLTGNLDLTPFTALTYVWCEGNQLTSLDVSKNTALIGLTCRDNQLTSLDVTKNTALMCLFCENNQLTSLDVTQNTALIGLTCENNQLTSLDVSKNIVLEDLTCGENQLTSLDFSKNVALKTLACENNQLTSLDVSKNTALTYLTCAGNQLTSLDFSNNTRLNSFSCDNTVAVTGFNGDLYTDDYRIYGNGK